MIPRIISLLLLVNIPLLLLGGGSEKYSYVFHADIPDSIKGIDILFEVKQVKVLYQGKMVNVFCLCTDITNQNRESKRIRIRYQCQGKNLEKEIEIGGGQQRIFLVDKSMNTEESPRI